MDELSSDIFSTGTHPLQGTSEPIELSSLDYVPQNILFLDGSDRIQFINNTALRYFNINRSDILLHHFNDLYTQLWPNREAEIASNNALIELGEWQGELEHLRPSGIVTSVEVSMKRVKNSNGILLGTIVVIRDISRRKQLVSDLKHSAEQLQDRVTEFETLFHIAPIGIHIAEDPQCRVIRSNPVGAEPFDHPHDQNISKSAPEDQRPNHFRILSDGQEIPAEDLPLQKTIATGEEIRDMPVDIERADGTIRHLVFNASPIRNHSGQIRGGIAGFADITERVRLESALSEREQWYRFLVDVNPDGIFVCWRGRIVFGNLSAARQFGFDHVDSLVGCAPLDFFCEGTLEDARARAADVIRGVLTSTFEEKIVRPDGTVLYVEITGAPIQYRDEPASLVVSRDVSLRKQTEAALIDSEKRLNLALIGGKLGTWDLDVRTNEYISLSDVFKSNYGFGTDEIVTRKDVYERIDPIDAMTIRTALSKAIEDHKSFNLHYSITWSDGSVHWINVTGQAFYDLDGNAIRLSGVSQDVTDQKLAEQRAQNAENQFRRLIDSQIIGVMIVNETSVIDANDYFLNLVGYSREDLEQGLLNWKTMTPPEYVEVDQIALDQLASQGFATPFKKEYYRKDGSRAPILLGASILSQESFECICFVLDRTDEVAALNALKEGELRYRTVIQSLEEGVIVQDANGNVRDWNPSSERILGISFNEITTSRSPTIPWKVIAEDGHQLRADEFLPMMTLQTGTSLNNATVGIEYPDGTQKWVLANSQPMIHPDTDALMGVATSFFDITERRAAEQELRANSEREAFINRLGVLLRSSLDPDVIQQTVTALLGQTFAVDRCFYVSYDIKGMSYHTSNDWYTPGIRPLAGSYDYNRSQHAASEMFKGGTFVTADTRTSGLTTSTIERIESTDLRAIIAVPFFDDNELVASLAIGSKEPRKWTPDEIALVEQAATLTRTAVEMAVITKREHNIALQLQSALQPEIPSSVPGLRLAGFYRAALDEAGVGGDFSDVFRSKAGETFLVVGDVSGKGLAAASQVAIIRNMLRYSLFNQTSVEFAISQLNQTLAINEQIKGFATLFACKYDNKTRELTYVNCAQDAGLILRKETAGIEALTPTGTVLGTFDDAKFDERTVKLESGDILLIYTDGISEAGPNRAQLLLDHGVAEMMRQIGYQTEPSVMIERLMDQVDLYARRIVRDDQCILCAVVM